jgi:hypothetical protein
MERKRKIGSLDIYSIKFNILDTQIRPRLLFPGDLEVLNIKKF